ncbi:NADH-quinone oxidoreductase subunit H [Candidatus Deianiraea vastatrix]|uniref:NADH-quinone oxidoreductase subunit H n=2 Tax=Candidatus Deianiraea vastatrix TaxID=2163644 RepID=A0A5B8XBW3_9RICK|nr:NADH-quinone oxidoreductase subunit NuoH [Candidatus Deianiraea vastatrix]QED22842.1 NADH-quinone oxidoreductase subunit H [Candidatus Deianiraea vastatrix]
MQEYSILLTIFQILCVILPVVIMVAFLVYAERKIIGAIQLRVGPSVVGPFGILQSFADAIKGMNKEVILPSNSDKFLFLFAPILTFSLALLGWSVIPFQNFVLANIDVGVSYLLAISAMGVYGIIIAGYASNSQYAFLGAIRSASQMISYEIAMGFCILCVLVLSESLNLTQIVNAQQNMWFCIPLFPVFIIFFISILAETNRHPFDLPEAESEIVSGYNIEYSSMPFVLFFLGEYANMILMSTFCTILFLGGWLAPFEVLSFIPGPIWFLLKVCFLLFMFILVRAALPRYRYDQLMKLSWKVFMPISFGYFVLVAIFKYFFA